MGGVSMGSRVCGGALAFGICALLPVGAAAQTTENEAVTEETTPSATEQPDATTSPELEGDVPAIEIIQPQEEPQQPPEPVQAAEEAEPEPRIVTINGVEFEIAYDLFTWNEGDFHFVEDELPSFELVPISLGVQGLVLERTSLDHGAYPLDHARGPLVVSDDVSDDLL